jgi:outer membrane protein TolC
VQPTALWGTSFFAGWRIGRGWDSGIPGYYGYEETLNRGEVRVGATVPLWQNGAIDTRRAGVRRAEANRDATEHELRSRRLRLAVVASEAYVRWLAAAKKTDIAAELLRIAEERDAQIRARVLAGAIPAIEELENRRVILERRAALVATVRQMERAAIALSLFLRRADGVPLVATQDRAPQDFDFHPWLAVDPDVQRATALAWTTRPEIARLGPIAEAARVTRELAQNQVSPRLDLTLQGSLDVGSGATTQAVRDRLGPPVFEGGLTLAIPLQLRDARGRVDTASAELRQIDLEVELARNTIEAEVRDAVSAFLNARTTVDLASESARVAAAVRDAERSRFENGLGTLLMVNLRESAAAQAQAVLVDAHADFAMSHAMFGAAVGSLLN